MSESVFLVEGASFIPTEHARGPWDPRALHGGAPAALIAAAFERIEPGSELPIARLGFEFLRPIPFAPLTLSTRIVRPGRRVQELAGELHAGEELICRASALRVQEVPADLPGPPPLRERSARAEARLPPPASGKPVRFALDGSTEASFAASAMEMRWLDDPWALGPGRVWMRLRHPLLPGRAAHAADAPGGDRGLRQRRQRRAAVRALPVHQRRPHDPPAPPPARRVDRPRRAHAAARRRHGHGRERAARREGLRRTSLSDAGRPVALTYVVVCASNGP